MLRQILVLLTLTAHISLFAQNKENLRVLSYIQKAMNYNKVMPQEKVYMHFDNTGYFKNETMWFKAYVTRTDKQKATDLSKVLYVELLNMMGDVILTNKYPIDSLGQANGDFKLDTLVSTGFYEVRAYTRYMTNWGTDACFSRVFPIFRPVKNEGDYSDLTLERIDYRRRLPNKRVTHDSAYQKAKEEGIYSANIAKTVSVSFYPEGGSLIKGMKCRVAMLAVDDNGLPFQGEGYVSNADGDVLTLVRTDSLGRGVFFVTPDDGAIKLQVNNLKNKAQFYTLPKAEEEGCALSVDAVSDSISATLQCTGNICGSLLGIVIMNNGNVMYCDTVRAHPMYELVFGRDEMADGVSQFVVFNSKGRVLADRLFFKCPKPDAADSIRIVAKTARPKVCGKIELELQTVPNASLSFSAMDHATMNNGKQGNMKTWMLLGSEVRGYIHNVDYYFEADDAEHRRAADLLMLTQGWRRYIWEIMTEQYTFSNPQPVEDRLYMYGRLREYRKRNKASNVALDVYMYHPTGQSLSGKTVTDSVGNYAFELPNIDGEWKTQIYSRINNKRKTFRVGIDRQISPEPRYVTRMEAEALKPVRANLYDRYFYGNAADTSEFIPITSRDIVLQNVTVKAKRRYFTNDDFIYKNQNFGKLYASVYYDVDRELDNILDKGEFVPGTMDFIMEKLGIFKKLYIDQIFDENTGLKGFYNNFMFEYIIDNNERRLSLFPVFLDEVQAMYVVFNGRVPIGIDFNKGSGGYFNQDSDPRTRGGNTIYIYLYLHHQFTTASNKGLRRTYFQGFNKPSTFKMEDYSVLPPMADFRRTIYWNPNVRTDSEGKARIEFYNNSTCEEMYISAEGMSDDGRVIVNE